jgi:hypothetical protein
LHTPHNGEGIFILMTLLRSLKFGQPDLKSIELMVITHPFPFVAEVTRQEFVPHKISAGGPHKNHAAEEHSRRAAQKQCR